MAARSGEDSEATDGGDAIPRKGNSLPADAAVARRVAASPELLREAIEHFINHSKEPRLLEPGQPVLVLDKRYLQQQVQGNRLLLEAWDEEHFVSRRVSGCRVASAQRLELTVDRFGGKTGTLILFDAARPSNLAIRQRGNRQVFGELFRRMLCRQFPGWRIVDLSTEPDLEHSLSHSYPRAYVRQGATGWAAMAAPPHSDADSMLSFGLIWLDYLRRRETGASVQGLAVFVPRQKERTTCLRLRWLDPQAAKWAAFAYGEDGRTMELDLADWGNFDTRVDAPGAPAPLNPEAFLEDQLRAEIQTIDPMLRPQPLYQQVPGFAGGDRGIIDILACDYTGRLTVMEVKAVESVQLPLQALDYWMRVRWHLERGDFHRHGYFPGIALRDYPPKLVLAAPAIQFHPANETVLRFFRPEIEVEWVGLGSLLAGPLRVMFRNRRGLTFSTAPSAGL